MEKIGIIRLEQLSYDGHNLTSKSSFVSWLNAASAYCKCMIILAPICLKTEPPAGEHFTLRNSDTLLSLSDASGYFRVFCLFPRIMFHIFSMRRQTNIVLCRAPEHGNLFVLPLLKFFRFKTVIWLVGHREKLLEASVKRRGTSTKIFCGILINKLTGVVERSFLKCNPVIANGSELAKYTKDLDVKRKTQILRIVSTNLSEKFINGLHFERNLPLDIINILYVGRIATDKGLGDLLNAFNIISKDKASFQFKLHLIGWGSHGEEEKIKESISISELNNSIYLHGAKSFGPELFEWYKNADMFILPSHSEGTPRVLVEAMAFGLPIVATNVGGVPDLICDYENGILVPPNSPEHLAEAVLFLTRDIQLYSKISANNFYKAKTFTVERLCHEMFSFIHSTTKK